MPLALSDTTWPSEIASPAPNVTATAPNTMAATVISVRAGRANGAASPSVTARGTELQPRERPVRDVSVRRPRRPAARDRLDRAHPPGAQRRGTAPAMVSASAASGTATSTQNGTLSVPTW